MATVTLTIGENRWPVSCRDGEEARLEQLGAMVAERWEQAQRASGLSGGTLQALLLTSLMMADELADAKAAARAPGETAALSAMADRLEKLAATLEKELAKP